MIPLSIKSAKVVLFIKTKLSMISITIDQYRQLKNVST